MGLILVAVFGYDNSTPFPGAAALLPVLGVVALIWANEHQSTWVGRVLSTRLMVGLGLISYSWYLWHWPVFVFGSYAGADEFGPVLTGGLIALTLILGYLSWRFVETPFRERRILAGRRQILVAAGLGILVLGLAGQALRWTDGLPSRLSEQALQYARASEWAPELMACITDDKSPADTPFCRYGQSPAAPAQLLVWGDSHATALIPALEDSARQHGVNVMLASSAGCLPLEGLEHGKRCADYNRRVERTLATEPVRDILLVARWSLYLYGDAKGDHGHALRDSNGHYDRAVAEQRLADGLRARVEQLREAGYRVWLMKEAPLQPFNPPYRLSRLAMLHQPTAGVGMPVEDHLRQKAFINRLFADIAAADQNVRVLDPTPQLCDASGLCRAEQGGYSLYTDDNHLSQMGAKLVLPVLTPLFEDVVAQGQAMPGEANTSHAHTAAPGSSITTTLKAASGSPNWPPAA